MIQFDKQFFIFIGAYIFLLKVVKQNWKNTKTKVKWKSCKHDSVFTFVFKYLKKQADT